MAVNRRAIRIMDTVKDPQSSSLSPKRRLLLFLLGGALLILGIVVTFQYVIFSDSTELSGLYDVYRYFGPLAYYMDHCLHSGEFPFWNPVTYCGMPYAANPQVAAYYPPNLLRSLLTFAPTPYRTQFGLVVLMGLHLLLAGGGTWLLARSHGISRIGAWTAVIAFTFSALMIRRVCEYHFVYTLNWLPLLLWLAKNLLDAVSLKAKLYWAAAAGLVFGMAVLGGFFQIVNYMAVSLAGYALLYRILHPRTAAKLRGKAILTGWVKDGAALWAIIVLMGLVGCILLFPAMELAKYTGRQPGVAVPMYSNLYERIGLPILQDAIVYPGMKYQAEALRGSGVVALILSLAAIFLSRRRDTIVFAGLFLILLDCSFGPPLPISWLVDNLTPFAPSAYSRAYDLAVLPLSLLAGFGVDGLMRAKGRKWVAWIEGVVVLLIGAFLVYTLRRWIQPGHYLKVSQAVWILPAFAVAFMGAARFAPSGKVWILGALPVLLFCETLAWNIYYVPMMTHQRSTPLPNVVASMPQDNSRGTDEKANRDLFRLRHLINGYDPLNLNRTWKALVDPSMENRYSRLAKRLSITAGNHRGNLLFKRSFWLARQWVNGPLPAKNLLFPAATTVFLSAAGESAVPEISKAALTTSGVSEAVEAQVVHTPEFTVPIRGGGKVQRGLKFDLPTAIAGRKPGPAGAVHSVLRLQYTSTRSVGIESLFKDRNGDRSEYGLRMQLAPSSQGTVEFPLPDYPAMTAVFVISAQGGSGSFAFTAAEVLSDKEDEDGLITIQQRSANAIDLAIGPLDGPRLLTCLDADYPGWKALVDGVSVPIRTADEGFKAIALPPGEHRVRFVFVSTRAYAGIGISLTIIAAILFMLIRFRSWTREEAISGPH